jgi:peroxiredoxin
MRGEGKLTMPALDLERTLPEEDNHTPKDLKGSTMTISVGDKLPDVKLVKATAEGPQQVQSGDYFAGRRVALFSVPGAFTPTCSAKHLPGFVEKAGELAAKGIDEIACTAVNDAFVLGAWNKAGGSDAITMLADGNAELAEALGLTMDGSGFGMGKRGQRFSMVVNDGVVEQLNVEAPGDFKVSSAEHMLGQL